MTKTYVWRHACILTAATGIRISTNKPASACFISLSFTSKKYWAHSLKGKKGSLDWQEVKESTVSHFHGRWLILSQSWGQDSLKLRQSHPTPRRVIPRRIKEKTISNNGIKRKKNSQCWQLQLPAPRMMSPAWTETRPRNLPQGTSSLGKTSSPLSSWWHSEPRADSAPFVVALLTRSRTSSWPPETFNTHRNIIWPEPKTPASHVTSKVKSKAFQPDGHLRSLPSSEWPGKHT